MGVPKFYRWISERYPCLSEVINDTQIPEFDNLYLDMNGIIHNCSHPNDDDVTFRISEEQICVDIFAYIEKLFSTIRPKKVFYMAVDGVAPRAKMNQQRARRFMSARTAEEQLAKAKKKGEEIPDEKRFDSNCITPGTYFMTKLHNELAAWVERKINTDPAWQGIRVYLSGHDCPGEGEHKIMDFIRSERISEGYDPNTRHCMYGLDADLIMLGICSHEPHFSLLREEVKFNSRPPKKGTKKKAAPAKPRPTEITFHLLHLSLLREYLSWEFKDIQDKLSFPYDMERIVDDWVLMGFLVGNDFIPHLPHVHIHDDALPLLYATYKQVLPRLDGYLNESGNLNLKRFEIFLKAVAQNDKTHFVQVMEDSEFLRAKRGNTAPGQSATLIEEHNSFVELERFEDSDMSGSPPSSHGGESEMGVSDDFEPAFVSSDEDEEESDEFGCSAADAIAQFELESAAELLTQPNFDPVEDEFAEALALAEFKQMDDKEFENNVENCWSRSVGNSFKRHKRDYYREKLNYGNISKDQLRLQSEGYVRAIQWVLHYYYHGCVSWNWYFAHHYAPYISDVVDFSGMEMNFELSQPFHPFEQLLAVLPAASAECLPAPLRPLMCSPDSPIADFYPTDFETDLNGKKNDWEAVVLIPFIDENRLLAAIREKEHLLSAEEKARNSHGPHILVTTDKTKPRGQWAVRTLVDKDLFRIPQSRVVWGLLPNVKLDVYFPGFPTMKHLPHSAMLKEVNVCVFNMASRRPSMVLKVGEREEMKRDLLEIAFDLIGKEVCIDWPVLKMGLVDSIWGTEDKYLTQKYDEIQKVRMTDEEKKTAKKLLMDLKDRLIHRYAIDAEQANAIVFVRRFLGVSYEARDGVLCPVKQWGGADTAVPVLLPLLVTNVLVEEGTRLAEIPVEEAYPKKSKVFVLQEDWGGFGYPCLVDGVQQPGTPSCRVVVVAAIYPQPNVSIIRDDWNNRSMPWYSGFEAGRRSGVNGRLLARLTGFVFLFNGERKETERGAGHQEKMNIGLALKLSKRNQEVPDYTKRTPDGFWHYSALCVNLLREYKKRFGDLIQYLESSNTADDVYYASDIWPNEAKREEKWAELAAYLSSIPTNEAEKQEGGTEYVDSVMIEHLECAVVQAKSQGKSKPPNFIKSLVNPSKLFRAELTDGKVRPDGEADFQLLDRVVNVAPTGRVPLGYQGTIIGIHRDKLEVMFDNEFKDGYKRGKLASCARVPVASLINITYGQERKGRAPGERKATPPSANSTRERDRMGAGREKKAGSQSSSKMEQFPDGPSEPWIPKSQRKQQKANWDEKKSDFGAPPIPRVVLLKKKADSTAKGPTGKENREQKAVCSKEAATQELSALLGLASLSEKKKESEKKKKEVGKENETVKILTKEKRNKKGKAQEKVSSAETPLSCDIPPPPPSILDKLLEEAYGIGKTEKEIEKREKSDVSVGQPIQSGGGPGWKRQNRQHPAGNQPAAMWQQPHHHTQKMRGPALPPSFPPPPPAHLMQLFGAPPPHVYAMRPLSGSHPPGPQFSRPVNFHPPAHPRTFYRHVANQGHQGGPTGSDPKLTDLKPSTVSKPFSKKGKHNHQKAVSNSQPNKQPTSHETESTSNVQPTASNEPTVEASISSDSNQSRRKKRANRLAANFAPK